MRSSGSRVDDRGIALAKSLENLRELWIDYTRVTLRGLEALSGLSQLSVVFALPNKYDVGQCATLLSKFKNRVPLQYLCDMEIGHPFPFQERAVLATLLHQANYYRDLTSLAQQALGSGRWEEYTPYFVLSHYQDDRYLTTSDNPTRDVWGPWCSATDVQPGGEPPWKARFYCGFLENGRYVTNGPVETGSYDFLEELRFNWKRLGHNSIWYMRGSVSRELQGIGVTPESQGYLPKGLPYRGRVVLPYLRRGWDEDIEVLSLFHVVCEDADLRELRGLTKLKVLDLSGSNITGKGLVELSDCREIRYLNLSGTHLCDQDIETVAELFPNLRGLYCFQTHVTQTGARKLEELHSFASVFCNLDENERFMFEGVRAHAHADAKDSSTKALRCDREQDLRRYQGSPRSCQVCNGSRS